MSVRSWMLGIAAALVLAAGCGDDAAPAQTADVGTVDTSEDLDTDTTESDAPGDTTDGDVSAVDTTASDTTPSVDAAPDTTPSIDTAPPSCAGVTAQPEGVFLARAQSVTGELLGCDRALHAMAGADGSTLRVHIDAFDRLEPLTGQVTAPAPATLTLRFTDLLGTVLAETSGLAAGDTADLVLDRTGEFFVTLESDEPTVAAAYGIRVGCAAGSDTDGACDREYTRYPIVLMHGAAGTESFGGLIDYWNGVRGPMEAAGYKVLVDAVDPYQSSDVRASQWRAHLDGWVANGEARRFNLIAHSQGGVDARLLTADLDPERQIQSLITLSTPHRGTSLASIADGTLSNLQLTSALVDAVVDGLVVLYGLDTDQDVAAQMAALSVSGMEAFNDATPDRPDVYYASWAGKTCSLINLICQANNGGEIVNPLLSATFAALRIFEGDNDGIVGVDSAKWGDFRGTVGADHLNEIGLGITAPGYDPEDLLLDEARRLQAMGL